MTGQDVILAKAAEAIGASYANPTDKAAAFASGNVVSTLTSVVIANTHAHPPQRDEIPQLTQRRQWLFVIVAAHVLVAKVIAGHRGIGVALNPPRVPAPERKQ